MMRDRSETSHGSLRVHAQRAAAEDRTPAEREPFAPVMPGAELSPDDVDQLEWEKDLLVHVMAEHLGAFQEEVRDPLLRTAQHRFLDWFARDLRARQTPEEQRESEARAEDWAARVMAILAERTRPMPRVDSAPPFERLSAPGLLSVVTATEQPARLAPFLDLAVAAGTGRELWDEDCELGVPLPEELPDGRYLALRVAGESMTPLLHPGDVILVHLGAPVYDGMVIVARHPDAGYVVKRLQSANDAVELHSLNPTYLPLRLPPDDTAFLGPVVLRWCGHASAGGPPRSAAART